MYSWIENPIWILNPTLDLGPWNVKFDLDPIPRRESIRPIPSSVFEGSLTVTLLWWHFRELDPTLRLQEKSSKISSKDGIRSTWLVGMSSGFRGFRASSWLVTWESHISSTFSNKLFTSYYRNRKFTFIRIQAANFLESYGKIFQKFFKNFHLTQAPSNLRLKLWIGLSR